MDRREFIKSTFGFATAAALCPSILRAGSSPLPLNDVEFDQNTFIGNSPQTIIIYLMGGMGEIVGNMTNLDEIVTNGLSQIEYPMQYFTSTKDGFWKEAGGDFIQSMVDDGNATIFRTCEQKDLLKAHKLNQIRFMHGNDMGYESGMVSTLMHVLNRFNAVSEDEVMVNFSMVDSNFELLTDNAVSPALPGFLKPVSFGLDSYNPFARKASATSSFQDDDLLDELSFEVNSQPGREPKIGNMFNLRKSLKEYVYKIKSTPLPDGIDYTIDGIYDRYNFGKKLEAAMRILTQNPQTRVISLTTESWDDHSNAIDQHMNRGYYLFRAIHTAMEHAKRIGKENINIILFGDFGRNLNINSAYGWDHGNNQNVMFFGGKKYFNHLGTVGETVLDERMLKVNRIYTTPSSSSYAFEPYAVASTLYKLYGVKNPEVLTGGRKEIGSGLQNAFLKIV